MKRLRDAAEQRLLGMPSWVRLGLASLAVVVLLMFPVFGEDLQGWSLIAGVVSALIFAALTIGLSELEKRQAARLEVSLDVSLAGRTEDLRIVEYDADGVIDRMVTEAKDECLASLRCEQTPVRSLAADRDRPLSLSVSGELDPDDPLQGVTLGDLRRLEERRAFGEQLTDAEQATLSEARRYTIASVTKRGSLLNATYLASEPDKRTEEQYLEEVAAYLIEYRKDLEDRLVGAYAERGDGRLALTLVNPTDRVFEAVQVEVCLPGEVKAVDADRVYVPYSRPARPRPLGERRPISFGFPTVSTMPQHLLRTSQGVFDPNIDNSASARIVFPPLTLRPRARQSLDVVHLLVEQPPGKMVEGTWEATATNAEGRDGGNFSIRVSDDLLPARDLLAERTHPDS